MPGRIRALPRSAGLVRQSLWRRISDRLAASLLWVTVRFLSAAPGARTHKAGWKPALRPIHNRGQGAPYKGVGPAQSHIWVFRVLGAAGSPATRPRPCSVFRQSKPKPSWFISVNYRGAQGGQPRIIAYFGIHGDFRPHPPRRFQLPRVPFATVPQKQHPVPVVPENGLPPVAAIHRTINGARIFQAQFSGHPTVFQRMPETPTKYVIMRTAPSSAHQTST